MKRETELKALPSELALEDDSRRVLQELSAAEKESFYQKIKRNLEEQLKYAEYPIF